MMQEVSCIKKGTVTLDKRNLCGTFTEWNIG